jgi:hypothetical protein
MSLQSELTDIFPKARTTTERPFPAGEITKSGEYFTVSYSGNSVVVRGLAETFTEALRRARALRATRSI